jgi:hypothetical protein
MILKPISRAVFITGLIVWAAFCQQPSPTTQGDKNAPKAKEEDGLHLTFHNIAEGLGIIFGLVGLIAFLDQKRSAREQADVMSYVKRNMTKEVTEETIAALSGQLRQMEKQTKEELPKLARIAVLNEQEDRLKTALSEMYLQWKAIQVEIANVKTVTLDAEIESAIADRMLPAYIRKQKAEGGRERLAILGAGMAVTGILLPFPASRFVEAGLGAAMVLTILQLMSSSAITTRQQRNVRMFLWLVLAIAAISAGGFSYLFLRYASFSAFSSVERTFGLILAGVAIALVAGAYFIDAWVWRWLQRKRIAAF